MKVFSQINKYQQKGKNYGAPLLGLAKSIYHKWGSIVSRGTGTDHCTRLFVLLSL